MQSEDRPTQTKSLSPALLLTAIGTYMVAGFAHAAATADWPWFWPPMALMLAPIDALATERSVLGFTMIYGLLAVLAGLVAWIVGLAKLATHWRLRKQSR